MRRSKSWIDAAWPKPVWPKPVRPQRVCSRQVWFDEGGSASLEFITAGLILLVPLVYLVVAVSTLQGAALAVEGAARQAVRVYVTQTTPAEAQAAASRAALFALSDYGIPDDSAKLTVTCAPDPQNCLERGATVSVTVDVSVALPLVPPVLDLDVASSIPFTASATQRVSRFQPGIEP